MSAFTTFTTRRIEVQPLPTGGTPCFPRPSVTYPAYLGRDPRGALHRQARQRAAAQQELLRAHAAARTAPAHPDFDSDPDSDPGALIDSERRAARRSAVSFVALILLVVSLAVACTQCG